MTMAEPQDAQASPWAVGTSVPQAHNDVLYETVIEPYRSLKPEAFRLLMIFVVLQGVVRSILFCAVGAWPLTAFMALDAGIVWLAFRVSYRHARLFERVRLTRTALTVERVWPDGRRQSWALEPAWARVVVENAGEHEVKVTLASRGIGVVLGAFLGPEQREAVAETLRGALAKRLAGRSG
ncbi:MAG TPA: DUF2244 domain-containing protein [Alphaproteobacteria bacterium]|nr:DUF2244 domain-containing protein [Alphaproteobacteria bacterium]